MLKRLRLLIYYFDIWKATNYVFEEFCESLELHHAMLGDTSTMDVIR